MATSLNLNSLTVDQSGNASFSGLGSGIDFQSAIDSIIQAKHAPIDQINQRISDNQAKIAALQDLRTHVLSLQSAADKLRGSISFDHSSDAFAAKQAFTTATRTDSQTPSAASDLVGVSVTNAAQATSHTIEIQQIATAQKVASGSIAAGLNDPLNQSGSFQINGQEITVEATDSLLDIRDRINAADTGANATGVTASIVSISNGEQVLILTADKTGTDAAISAADTSGSVLQNLGVIDGTGAFQSELQSAKNAELTVDGLGTTIERQSNTIDDVFTGVTLDLYKAEPGTTVKVDVQGDLNQIKSAIVDVVDAYNELRTYINQQAETNVPADDTTGAGVLAGTSILSQARAQLAGAIGAAADGSDPTFAVLAQIGITIQAPSQVSDPTQANTLVIDESKLDDALLNHPDAVRSLFGFQMSSSSPDAVLAGFDGNTSYSADGYTLNVAYANGAIVSANIDGPADGSDDGSVTVSGKVLSVVKGGAKGLQLLYTGTSLQSRIHLDLSVGIGAKMYDTVNTMLDDNSGLIANEVNNLKGQDDLAQQRADRLQASLDAEHDRLVQQFAAMETAVTNMNQLLESLRQQTNAAFGNKNN